MPRPARAYSFTDTHLMRGVFYKIALLFAATALAVSCKHDNEVTLTQTGSMSYQGQTYALRTFRLAIDTVADGLYISDIQFAPSILSITDGRISGNGPLLSLRAHLDSAGLRFTDYLIDDSGEANTLLADSSAVTMYPDGTGDTVVNPISGGELSLTESALGYNASFRFLTASGDSITGRYNGPLTRSIGIDGDSVGHIVVDTIRTSLQPSKMWAWGRLFGDAYYYEIELLSSDFRYRDDGSPLRGLMFTVGLHTSDSIRPADGAYPISESPVASTAFYGHREKNTTWGTYWQLFENGTARRRANVTSDTVRISWNGNICAMQINLTDQLNNVIYGAYKSVTEIINPYGE